MATTFRGAFEGSERGSQRRCGVGVSRMRQRCDAGCHPVGGVVEFDDDVSYLRSGESGQHDREAQCFCSQGDDACDPEP